MATVDRKSRTAVTRRLAEWVAALGEDEIPGEVSAHVKLCLLDTLGCGLFGSTLPRGQTVIRFARSLGHGAEATVWGNGTRLPAANAALANGTLVHAFEMDDLHASGVLHPGAVSITTALAVAERCERVGIPPVRGGHLLTALVAGYEVAARIGPASGHAQRSGPRGRRPAARCRRNTGLWSSGCTWAAVLRAASTAQIWQPWGFEACAR